MVTSARSRNSGTDRAGGRGRHQRRRSALRIGLAILAIVIAFAGPAAASSPVGTHQIRNKAVTTPKIHNKAVTTPKIHNKAVTTPKIANHAVTANKIHVGAVG